MLIANQVPFALVNAWYGLGQVLISLVVTMNIIIAIQTKWYKRVSYATRIIGVSLRPHTSVTAFAEVVCMFVCPRPYTVNFK